MVVVLVVCLFPYLHVLAKALNDSLDTAMGGISIFPRSPTLYNFASILKRASIFRALEMSVLRVAMGTALSVSVNFACAFAIRKRTLAGRNAILTFLMLPMFFTGGIIPNYIMYSRVGLLDNFLVYILPNAFSFFSVLLVRTYMTSSIPSSLEESAMIDGAGPFAVLWRIYLPLSKPILATLTLWVAVYHWNDWITTLYYAQTNPRIFTLQYQLMRILRESEAVQRLISESVIRGAGVSAKAMPRLTPESIQNAQIVITILPIVLVYPLLQRHFIKGVMIGAIKE